MKRVMEPSNSSKVWWSRFFKTNATEARNPPDFEPRNPPDFEDGNPPTTEDGNPQAIEDGNSQATEDVTIIETSELSPELYLKLTTKCMVRMNKLFSSLPTFNQEQCEYLANKLDVAIKSAHSIIEHMNMWYSTSTSPEDMLECLEIFKLLFSMGLEVEGFIQDCYKDGWIQSALMLGNMSERIGSIGFNLEFCSYVFLETKLGRLKSFTLLEIANLHQNEASIVKEKANMDEMKLFLDLTSVTRLSMPNSTEWQLATFLLGRLKSTRLQSGVGLPTLHEFSHSNMSLTSLKQLESLGKGVSAIVYRSIWLGVEVAKKTFDGPSNPDFLHEVSILATLSHPNIVSLLWYMIDQRKSHIIMELMDGDLYTLMQARLEEHGYQYPFSISEALDLMLQTAEGMLFLHEMKIVHRDLKSSNILVNCGKGTKSNFKYVHAKVADFGLSKTKELSMTYSQQTQNMGTTRWMAPEMIKLGDDDGQAKKEVPKYPFKSDVYSFGMVCFEILTGDLPFSSITNPREVKKVVLSGDRPQLPDACPYKLKTLIEACWNKEASSRPHFGDICAELRHLKCEYLTCVWTAVPRSFSLDEIKKMTNEFSEGNRLGLDKVYKGVMVETGLEVAVEKVEDNYGLLTYSTWLKVLSKLHHENLMGCIGFCFENDERILVFENMPNFTLAKWLLGDEGVSHSWVVRRNICMGVANGIHYLHTKTVAKVIHRPINLRSIFLDANLNPKIGGFWKECTIPHIGSDKEDVYNYGVVLLEILSRRIVRKIDRVQQWAYGFYSSNNIGVIIDPSLLFQPGERIEAMRIIKIALLCIQSDANSRPDMTRVVAMLQGNMDEEIKIPTFNHHFLI